MVYEAAFWQPHWPRPALAAALADPDIGRYVRGWGRTGDTAVIATEGERPVGAAWYRLFTAEEPGYGFLDADTPELGIAVVADRRRVGVGHALMTALLAMGRAAGLPSISLSVAKENPSRFLYEKHGFVIVRDDETAWTMRADLQG
jgi:ribosomal protein S18 acetylase RimI-like enzyme